MEPESFTGDVSVVETEQFETYFFPADMCPNQAEAEVFLGPGATYKGFMKSVIIRRLSMPGYLDCTDWELASKWRKIHEMDWQPR